jgi:all-trans-retinol 13,14-reductase
MDGDRLPPAIPKQAAMARTNSGGSGIGGLVTGALLSKEGFTVAVLEKNPQIGGALQTYARDKLIFDSGVHYLGGLSKGQNLYQIFQYLGILEELKLVRMSDEVFDKILIEGDPHEYVFAQGYERFIAALVQDFPAEEKGIRAYAQAIKDVCTRFPLYNLRAGGIYQEKEAVLEWDAQATIHSFTEDPILREVLAGNTLLYAGQPDKTPFYIHALILNSFIESSWKCVDGGSQIARALARKIREAGGMVQTRAEVVRLVQDTGAAGPTGGAGSVTRAAGAAAGIAYAELAEGGKVYGDRFISSLHPAQTLALTDAQEIRPAYRKRIQSLENSISCFSVNIVLEPEAVPYVKHNYYYHRKGKAWTMGDYQSGDWPGGYAMFFSPHRTQPQFAASITLMTYMRFEDVEPWAFNTIAAEADRGPDYERFKSTHYQKLLDCAAEKFPWLPGAVRSWYAFTPLSLRDYLGTREGSLYGIVKDYKNPVKTIIPARTKIPNLYLTGQSLNLHGILGASISAMATCADVLGRDDFVTKIREA